MEVVMSAKQYYEGEKIRVCFDSSRCMHAGNCVKGLPEVFRPGADGAWIEPDAADVDRLTAVCESCPSGALSYQRNDGGADESKPTCNIMTIEDDGPLTIHADFTINGELQDGYRAVLCRCGASKNKPWCDGAHSEAGFKDSCSMPACAEASALPAGMPVDIQTFANGPLLLEGPFELRNAAGEPVIRTERTVLCRCGASKNKPYCDASHAAIGFKAD